MTRIFVDAATQARLGGLEEFLEFCDESGRVLGRFAPSGKPVPDQKLEPQISEEEIRRREKSTERRWTTAEVLAHLERL